MRYTGSWWLFLGGRRLSFDDGIHRRMFLVLLVCWWILCVLSLHRPFQTPSLSIQPSPLPFVVVFVSFRVVILRSFPDPNIFKSGKVCLSILNVSQGWRASLSFSQILLGIQDLLTHPNALDPANADANELFTFTCISSPPLHSFSLFLDVISTSVDAYEEKIRDQARRFVS